MESTKLDHNLSSLTISHYYSSPFCAPPLPLAAPASQPCLPKQETVPGEKPPANKERREKGESSPEGGSSDPDISGRRVVWVSHRRHVLQFLTSASAYRLCTYYRASGSGDDVHAPGSTTPPLIEELFGPIPRFTEVRIHSFFRFFKLLL